MLATSISAQLEKGTVDEDGKDICISTPSVSLSTNFFQSTHISQSPQHLGSEKSVDLLPFAPLNVFKGSRG